MTVFRPSARVTGPDGREWEIYAYKVTLRAARIRDLPRALVTMAAALRSDTWTIDAVTYLPHQTLYTWTTTSEHRGQVLAQVEGHLARGDIPARLANAVYLGEDRRSAR